MLTDVALSKVMLALSHEICPARWDALASLQCSPTEAFVRHGWIVCDRAVVGGGTSLNNTAKTRGRSLQ